MSRQSVARILSRYSCASYPVGLAVCLAFARVPAGAALGVQLFAWAVLLSYALLYLAPAWILTRALAFLAGLGAAQGLGRARRALVWSAAVLTPALTAFALWIDRSVYELFGFHLNGFVWNLVTTPGGIESLETSPGARLHACLWLGGLLALHALLLAWSIRRERHVAAEGKRTCLGRLVLACTLLLLAQSLAYAFSNLHGYTPVAIAAARFPGYQPLTIGRLAKRFGFRPEGRPGIELGSPPSTLAYPLAELVPDPSAARPNIVWLMVESLRADALTPEIMPRTYALAGRSLSCAKHYSGGNGTRMGTFALFYGLYGSYWFPILDEQREPVLMEALRQRGYRIEAWSSASFSYPELDKTVFAKLAPEHLHPYRSELSKPANDRALVRELGDFLESGGAGPFAAFLFFDSTHSRYHFETEDVIREPYAEDIDYTAMELERDIEKIRNRYLNAAHGIDARIGDLLELLERNGRSEDTLVLITGDHGQEFLEKGRWGHNSSFSEEQVRVPFVLYVPGRAALRLERLTSHLDVLPTVLGLLGYRQPASDYCLGEDLYGTVGRSFTVACNWSELCWIDEQVKISMPFRGPSWLGQEVRSVADLPLPDAERCLSERLPAMAELLRGMARFGKAGATRP